ncbi:metalloregulator ArsR/SmtB family transcription factor [Halanaerocella petrolearia]
MSLISKLKSDLFKALAHPTRIKVIELLTEGELCVCHIYEELDQSQSNISQHLSKLKQNQLVKSRKDGLKVYYSLKDEQIIDILDLAKDILLDQINETREVLTKE